jgi:hypothetical protein
MNRPMTDAQVHLAEVLDCHGHSVMVHSTAYTSLPQWDYLEWIHACMLVGWLVWVGGCNRDHGTMR